MKRNFLTIKAVALSFLALAFLTGCGQKKGSDMDSFVSDLMSKMTLEEKIGQLNLPVAGGFVAGEGKDGEESPLATRITNGEIGGLFGMRDVKAIKEVQKIAVEKSRLGIPLIFGFDVIHGYDITFPIPLGMSTSWDMDLIEKVARTSAIEASASGVDWVFSPMVDICHDARWGRIAEGAGEDPYLGAEVAKALVKGYQSDGDLTRNDNVMACVKHYALYGGAEAGRDYNTVDMSRQRALNEYMLPYKAACEAGAGSYMASFNEFEGIPATANDYLMNELLRGTWGFDGFIVTDYTGIMEMTYHGIGDEPTVAARALKAGIDMDMVSEYLFKYCKENLEKGLISEKDIDTACRRVLEAKYKLGLFDDPYKYCDEKRAEEILGAQAHVDQARKVAQDCQVLLKNDGNLLPLTKNKRIALIGPMADRAADMVGSWSGYSKTRKPVSLKQGLEEAVAGQGGTVTYAEGSWLLSDETTEKTVAGRAMGLARGGDASKVHARSEADLLAEALRVARSSDVIVAALGENANMNGEGTSRANPIIPEPQEALLKALVATGKPVVLVVFTGRPLILTWEDANVPAILNAWFPGIEAGHAIADVLFGDANPSAKLTTSFPRALGQLPYSYNHKNTGRPQSSDDAPYVRFRSNYLDVVNAPLYPFGYGLSYTTYEYSDVKLSAAKMAQNGEVKASVTVKNTGNREGKETVQLYIRDLIATSTRPVQELKKFQKISLKPGETKTVEFTITAEDLKYYNHDLKYVCEPGDFEIQIGPNCRDVKKQLLTVTD
ncbi:MAG: beta-glucosidase BglX [Bacteroidaceae bacterium]|jgi:beta-glucosidase|nr:beta-glucosidase BglX [Bacteroidaceae bacterium]